jgi:hypothetical protein
MRMWENNIGWMRRRSCDKTPCSLVGKYQNAEGHITKDRLLTADCRGYFTLQYEDGANRGTGTANRNARTSRRDREKGMEEAKKVRTISK